MDKSSFVGVILGLGGIVVGLLLEGGKLSQVVQPTAAIIVFGGTLGAVLLQFPLPVVASAFRRLAQVFFEPKLDPQLTVEQLVVFANKARRHGIDLARRRIARHRRIPSCANRSCWPSTAPSRRSCAR